VQKAQNRQAYTVRKLRGARAGTEIIFAL
jgi:hypothetical protein